MDISTDHSTGIKFGDLRKQERFKRLERDLRLEFIKHMERIKADIDKCTSPTWPSLSSINPDNINSSCANGPSLQVSRVESEVIASSANLQKVFPMPKSGQLPMATSSVKHFSMKDYDKDRAIMPPPSTSNFPFTGVRRFANQDLKQNEQIQTHDFSTKMSSAGSCSSYQENSLNTSQNLEHSRTFTRWRVLLNSQGQLIIKGTLDCGKIARSKPIIHRLSSTTVQSIYKHIYVLIGSIVDEKDELPDYVRGKFHNGFPDDWENVYQLWTSFVSGGCKETFRWPTHITDSDDDLYSEITDFSYLKNRQIQYREEHPKIVVNNGSSLGYHSRTQSDSNLNFEKLKEDKLDTLSYNKHQINNKSIEDSGHQSSEIRDSNACSNEHGAKNITPDSHNTSDNFLNSNLKNASFLSQIIKEEKLRIIMSNLGDKNCPSQYLDKLIELSDCLRFILSYTPDICSTDYKKTDLSESKLQNQVCEKCNHSTISLVESSQEDSLLKLENKNESVKTVSIENPSKLNEQSEHTPATKYSKQKGSHGEATHTSSDSDSCMGVPHIPVNRLIQPKLPRFERYRDRRNRNRERNGVKKNGQVETKIVPTSNVEVLTHDDSSVSITEDEFERRKHQVRDHQFQEPFSKTRNEESSKIKRVHSFDEKNNENVNTINYKSNSPSISSKPGGNVVEKHKPVIKSCERAHYKLVSLQKVKKQTATPPIIPSDITILSEDVSMTVDHLNSKNKNQNENMGQNQEKLQKDILKHPFLTYDSEDYFNEKEASMQIELPPSMLSNKTKDKKTSSFEKNKENPHDVLIKQEHPKRVQTEQSTLLEVKKSVTTSKSNRSETFGSKHNPKLLISWVPCVEYDKTNNKLSLKFEGKLLNEREHVLNRKFTTNPILQRHSSKLISTENNEYFMLIGELSDTKHVVPKELLKQCYTGCPLKIQEFCENWKKLSSEKGVSVKPDYSLNASIDHLDIPTSKRGRPMIPSLSYWNGERLVKKESVVLYDPGNRKENFLTSKVESTKKKPSSEQRPQRNKSNKDTNLKGSMSSKSAKTKESPSDTEKKQSPLKKCFVQQLTYSSEEPSDTDGEPKKFRKLSDVTRPYPVLKLEKMETRYNTRQNNGGRENIRKTIKPNLRQTRTPSTRPQFEWSYEKDRRYPDLLSDDQVSVIK